MCLEVIAVLHYNSHDDLIHACVLIRPDQFWVNVSDLYASWSKVAVGLIIHKNYKKS